MKPAAPPGFDEFHESWNNLSTLSQRRKHYTKVAGVLMALGALQERQRLISLGWIEPKPVIPPRPYTSSPDHEREYVTGLSIPETPA